MGDIPFTTFAFPAVINAPASAPSAGAPTPRTMPARLADVKNVLDFGADPTGVADSTTAIQAAVDWNTVTVQTNAGTAAGGTVLNFAAGVIPAWLVGKTAHISNVTHPLTIVNNATQSISGTIGATSITLLSGVITAVTSGDTIKIEQTVRGTIYFPPGTYTVSGPIHFDTDGICFHLVGYGAVINANFDGYVFDRNQQPANNASGIRVVEGFQISNSHATGGGIRLTSGIGGVIRNCQVGAHRCITTLTSGGALQFVESFGSPGSGYAVGDTITLAGGTGTAAHLLVCSIGGGGAITSTLIYDGGNYSVPPSNPISQASTSGSGTGATFNILAGSGAMNIQVKDCVCGVAGNTAGSWGICFGGNTIAEGNDITGFETGIVASGQGVSILGGRYEINGNAIHLGVDDIGNTLVMNGFSIADSTFEQNVTAIKFTGPCSYGEIRDLVLLGYAVANAYGIADIGIDINGHCRFGSFRNISVGGSAYATATINVGTRSDRGYITFQSILAGSLTPGWSMPTKAATAVWIECDNPAPVFTIANLPSGADVTEGDEYTVSNCDNTKVWGDTAVATGTPMHAKVRWNGSNWIVIGK